MAKRTAQPVNKYEVISWYKWFDWSLCCVCNQEFRREKGFAWSRSNTTYTKFMCASCGCHSEDFVYVNEYIDYMIGSKRLPVAGASVDLPHIPPQAPPMRQVRSNS